MTKIRDEKGSSSIPGFFLGILRATFEFRNCCLGVLRVDKGDSGNQERIHYDKQVRGDPKFMILYPVLIVAFCPDEVDVQGVPCHTTSNVVPGFTDFQL